MRLSRSLLELAAASVAVLACGSSQNPEQAAPVAPAATEAPETAAEPDGGLSLDDLRMGAIAKAVNDTIDQWHECWAVGAADDFRLSGQVVVEVSFDADGKAKRVEVVRDQTGDPMLTACLVEIYENYDWPPVFNETASARFPFQFEPTEAQYTVRRRHIEPAVLAAGKLTAQVVLDGKNTGNAALGLSRLALRQGLDVEPHVHETAAEVIYVLSGTGRAYDHRGKKKAVAVKAHDVIYAAAGAPHALEHTGTEDLVVLSLYAPGGAEQRFKGGTDPGTKPYAKAARKRRPRARIRSVDTDEPFIIAGGHGKVFFGFEKRTAKDAAAYAGRIHIAAGVTIPLHQHDKEAEVLYLLEGEGTLTVAGTKYPVAAGDAIQCPPGVMHSFAVAGNGPVTAVQFYTPAGPEQRFKPASK